MIKHTSSLFANQHGADNGNDSDNDEVDMLTDNTGLSGSRIVVPGELITSDPQWMRGHGTYHYDNNTYSSIVGPISKVNKLLSVDYINSIYLPETGDHVIGRIIEVGNKRWKVDIGSRTNGILMLGSVNLPGGILRRKSESDELQMRNFLKEGDVLNAEIQSIFSDGSASLHTRSLKYGKLRDGIFLKIDNSLIVRSKNHTHNLPGGVTILLGVNGYIWIRKTNEMDLKSEEKSAPGSTSEEKVSITRLEEESSWKIYSDKNDENISPNLRKTIFRYSNVIKALAYGEIGITKDSIISGYEASITYSDIGKLIEKEVMENICEEVMNIKKMRG